jgi:hypothetical protein
VTIIVTMRAASVASLNVINRLGSSASNPVIFINKVVNVFKKLALNIHRNIHISD